MQNRRSYPARDASSSQGPEEASAAAAADGNEENKRAADEREQEDEKNSAPSPSLLSGERAVWSGEKKAKIYEQEQGPQQIEGLDWDKAMLKDEIDNYIKRYRGLPDDDSDFWEFYDEQQLTELQERLVMYRIRAHEISKGTLLKGLEDAELIEKYPLSTLEENGYYEWYEKDFEWYFDPEYCKYARLQDYQRLLLRNNGEYEDWEYYRETCSSLESDQQFVKFWEELSSKTKWLGSSLATSSEPRRFERLAFYHAVKIAAGFPDIFSNLLHCALTQYLWSVKFDYSWGKGFACLYFEIWKLTVKDKMDMKAALDQVKEKGMKSLCFYELRAELESAKKQRPGPITHHFGTYLAHIGEDIEDGHAYQLILEAVKQFIPKRKMYYDYAKKKLDVAEKIGVIPTNPYKSSA